MVDKEFYDLDSHIRSLRYSVIAKRCGLDRSTVSRILRGKVGYTERSLQRIACVVDVDIGQLARYVERRKR